MDSFSARITDQNRRYSCSFIYVDKLFVMLTVIILTATVCLSSATMTRNATISFLPMYDYYQENYNLFNDEKSEYYYARQRDNPHHLRVAERLKNQYVDDLKTQPTKFKTNATNIEYYQARNDRQTSMSYDEIIFETIDRIFRHRLSPFYIHTYDKASDKRRASDPAIVSQSSCSKHLTYLVDKLQANKFENANLSPELTGFFDSYAKSESGILHGNTFWPGNYDLCSDRHIFDIVQTVPVYGSAHHHLRGQDVIQFDGRYCVAAIKSTKWKQMIERRKVESKHYFKTADQVDVYSKMFRLELGMCLPSSCDSTSIERHLDEIKFLLNHHIDDRLKDYQLDDLYCLPDSGSELRSITGNKSYLTFIIFMTVWLTIVAWATMADFLDIYNNPCKNKSTGRQVVTIFSLIANFNKFMHVSDESAKKVKLSDEKESNPANDNKHDIIKNGSNVTTKDEKEVEANKQFNISLRFLDAFKVLIMVWIINGHVMLLMIQTAKNVLYSDGLINLMFHFNIGATFGVDLFFTMTGIISSYMLFNSGYANKMKPVHWMALTVQRYWRLAPIYLIAFWFSKSVVQNLSSGPLWDYGTSSITYRGICNEQSWWYPITLTSNLHPLFEECIITSWYVSCDMQFWIASPVLLHLIAKSPVQGWIATLAAIIASTKLRAEAIGRADLYTRYDELVKPRADIFMRLSHDMPELYTHPQYRIGPYLLGLLAGHYIYMVSSGNWRCLFAVSNQDTNQQVEQGLRDIKPNGNSLTLRSILTYLGCVLVTIMALSSYIANNFFPTILMDYRKTISIYGYALAHEVMSIGFCLIIICMSFGQWSRLKKILAHPVWTRLSKLNYSLLLFQCEAIYCIIFRQDFVPPAGTKESIDIMLHLFVYLYPMAMITTLVLEFPLANLAKLVFKK